MDATLANEPLSPSAEYIPPSEEQVIRPRKRKWWGFLTGFVARRLLRCLFVIYLVTTLFFFLVRLLPGDPIQVYINQQMSQYGYSYDDAKNQAQSLYSIDVDEPVVQQYARYMRGLVEGDLGMSLASAGTSVSTIIMSRIWWTIASVGIALVISFTAGSLLGMLMAYKRGTWIDSVLSAVASITHSVPNYLVAIMIIVFFGIQRDWIPFANMRGAQSAGVEVGFSFAFVKDFFYHACLPIGVYVLTTIGTWMLLMKSSTVAALEEDFVTAARARGIPEWRVLLFYVGRNAILPLFTALTISIGFVVGGSILVEQVFVYQGIGSRFFEAIAKRDYTVLQGIALFITISVVLANFVADMLYSRLDPRIRSGR